MERKSRGTIFCLQIIVNRKHQPFHDNIIGCGGAIPEQTQEYDLEDVPETKSRLEMLLLALSQVICLEVYNGGRGGEAHPVWAKVVRLVDIKIL